MINKRIVTTFQRFFVVGILLFLSAACKQAHPELQNLRSLSGFELDQNSVAVSHKLNPAFVVTGICNSQYSTIDISLDNGSTWGSAPAMAHQATIDCQTSGKFRLDFSSGMPTSLSNVPNVQLVFRAVSDLGFSEIRSLSILQKQAGAMILAGTHNTTVGSGAAAVHLVGRVGGSASAQSITTGYQLKGSVRSQ